MRMTVRATSLCAQGDLRLDPSDVVTLTVWRSRPQASAEEKQSPTGAPVALVGSCTLGPVSRPFSEAQGWYTLTDSDGKAGEVKLRVSAAPVGTWRFGTWTSVSR